MRFSGTLPEFVADACFTEKIFESWRSGIRGSQISTAGFSREDGGSPFSVTDEKRLRERQAERDQENRESGAVRGYASFDAQYYEVWSSLTIL